MSADEYEIPLMSTGQPSTLGNWHAMCAAVFGVESPATEFVRRKMVEQGEDMAVIADEGQFLYALLSMHAGPTEE